MAKGQIRRATRLFARLALAMALLGIAGPASATGESDVLTALLVRVVAPPNPVLGADDKIHLAYELEVVNKSNLVLLTVDSLKVLDPASGAVLQELGGPGLAKMSRFPGASGTTLPPGHSGYVFMDVTLPARAAVPRQITHRVEASRQSPRSPEDTHHGVPLTPASGIEPAEAFTIALTAVGAAAIVVSPPLKGLRWIAGSGCCNTITPHRGAIQGINGAPYVPERFAIDFLQLDQQGRLFVGPGKELKSYPAFGAEVLAAAGGTVVSAHDGRPEQIPGSVAKDVAYTLDVSLGNNIVVDIGGGRFAFYAHLQPGSLRVKPGDKVVTGQVLALLGNSGNTDAPHLHFHIMDGPSPLKANGLPYAFTRFTGRGVVTGEDLPRLMLLLSKGEVAPIDKSALAGPHVDQLPLNLQVIDFD